MFTLDSDENILFWCFPSFTLSLSFLVHPPWHDHRTAFLSHPLVVHSFTEVNSSQGRQLTEITPPGAPSIASTYLVPHPLLAVSIGPLLPRPRSPPLLTLGSARPLLLSVTTSMSSVGAAAQICRPYPSTKREFGDVHLAPSTPRRSGSASSPQTRRMPHTFAAITP